jgi:aspartyl protease family protein
MLMRLILLAAVTMILAGAAAQYGFFDRFVALTGAPAVSSAGTAPTGPVVLQAGDGGHFFVDASISGRPVRFMIDTGASVVVLSGETARRIGIRPAAGDFSGASQTANGIVAIAPVRLDEIRIGSIRLRNVDAAVLPEGASNVDLLGMTFLKRLRSFQSSGRQMTLSP